LSSNRLYDNGDNDNSGTRFWVCDGSGALVSAAWGQDPNTAFFGAPSLDLGTTIVPGPAFRPTKENKLIADIDNDGFLDAVIDTAEFCICVANSGALTYIANQIKLTDVLAAEFDYVPNSAYTLFGGVQTPIANAGTSPFPMDENGFTIPFNLNPNDVMSVCYSVTLNQLLLNRTIIVNEVSATDGITTLSPKSRIPADNVCPLDNAPVIEIIDNDCTTDTAGAINVITGCLGGSTLEWSIDGGITWSAIQPVYDSTASSSDPIVSITVRARCVLDIDPTCISPETADLITAPEQCCPTENCIRQYGEFTIIKRRP